MQGVAMSLRVTRDRDVLVIRPQGVFAYREQKIMRDTIWSELKNAPARALLLDMRCILNVMSDEQRILSGEEIARDSRAKRMPLAMVVSEGMLKAATAECAAMWSYGFFWVPFLDLPDALDWARRRQRLFQPVAPVVPGSQPQP